MEWRLRVYPADRAASGNSYGTPRATYDNASPGGIVGGFEWDIDENGGALQLRFRGSPYDPYIRSQRLDIRPRDIVQLQRMTYPPGFPQGLPTTLFTGVITICANPKDRGVKEYVAEGLKRLVSERVLDERRIAGTLDASAYVHTLTQLAPRTLPTQIVYDGRPADTGYDLSEFFAPFIRLSEALDLIAKAVPEASWGVDKSGRFFFGVRDLGSLALGANEARADAQAIRAEEVVGRVVLIVAAQPNRALSYMPATETLLKDYGYSESVYQPIPITFGYTSAAGAVYGAPEIARQLPGLSGFREEAPTTTTSSGLTNITNAFDGDAGTYADSSLTGGGFITTLNSSQYGVRVTYRADSGDVRLYLERHQGATKIDQFYVNLPSGDDTVHTQELVMPRSATAPEGSAPNTYKVRIAFAVDTAGDFRLYEWQHLGLNYPTLINVAQSYLKEPAAQPTTLTVEGYRAPVSEITYTDEFGDSVTLPVKRTSYKLTVTEGMQTIFQLEQPEQTELAGVIARKAEDATVTAEEHARLNR